MQHARPLLQVHPEFSIRRCPSYTEYRVENWRIARDGSGRVLKFHSWSWIDYAVPVVVAVFWRTIIASKLKFALASFVLVLYVRSRCTQVLWESILVLPSLGLQLETHRGLPNIPLFVSKRFIPLVYLQDFVINEGLRGWTVRYYLTAIQNSNDGKKSLEVAYENILPYFPILLEVYRDIQETVFDRNPDLPKREETANSRRDG